MPLFVFIAQTVLHRQDAGSNAELSKEDFKVVVMLGWLEGPRQEQIDAFFDFIDADHNGSISEEEFHFAAASLWGAAGLACAALWLYCRPGVLWCLGALRKGLRPRQEGVVVELRHGAEDATCIMRTINRGWRASPGVTNFHGRTVMHLSWPAQH